MNLVLVPRVVNGRKVLPEDWQWRKGKEEFF